MAVARTLWPSSLSPGGLRNLVHRVFGVKQLSLFFFERPEGPLLSHRGSARRPALALSLPVSVSGDRHSVVTRWSARSRTLASFRFESSDFFARRSLFQRPLGAFTSRAPRGCLVPAHPFREAGS